MVKWFAWCSVIAFIYSWRYMWIVAESFSLFLSASRSSFPRLRFFSVAFPSERVVVAHLPSVYVWSNARLSLSALPYCAHDSRNIPHAHIHVVCCWMKRYVCARHSYLNIIQYVHNQFKTQIKSSCVVLYCVNETKQRHQNSKIKIMMWIFSSFATHSACVCVVICFLSFGSCAFFVLTFFFISPHGYMATCKCVCIVFLNGVLYTQKVPSFLHFLNCHRVCMGKKLWKRF